MMAALLSTIVVENYFLAVSFLMPHAPLSSDAGRTNIKSKGNMMMRLLPSASKVLDHLLWEKMILCTEANLS